ncbi:MAG: bacterial Ig-like domain-containing protein [Spirochaetaceae bacterium]|nr:bacterial Ig-like domain-containing protein [Spirochaetaceae bacterium]
MKRAAWNCLCLAAAVFWLWGCEQDGPPVVMDSGGMWDDLDYTEPEVYEPYITGVVIKSYPDTTYFAKGQPFSYAGLVLCFVYDNGNYGKELGSGDYEVDSIDTEALAPASSFRTKAVSIKILNTEEGSFPALSYTIAIDSSTSVLTDIKMTSPPSKKVYYLGEKFSASGVAVSGTYSGGDRDGQTETLNAGLVTPKTNSFNSSRRGTQTVTLMFNGKELGTVDVTVRLAPGSTIKPNGMNDKVSYIKGGNYKPVRVKGAAFDLARSDLRATVTAGGSTFTLDYANGSITDGDITGYKPDSPGMQTLTLNLDGIEADFEMYVADAEPAAWFDYGYRRLTKDPSGRGWVEKTEAFIGEGVYYAKPGQTIVISPVRFLVGYDAEHKDTGVTYSWTVGAPYTLSAGGEFCEITPAAAGKYNVSVNLTGNNFVTGQPVTVTATTQVVCYTGTAGGANTFSPLKNFAPGQHNEGNGYGWSLGAALGYEVWSLPYGASTLEIYGNPFGNWSEAGIVWVQYDENGNGLPDEMWYELTGGEEDDAVRKSQITRRYAVSYFRGPNPAGSKTNEYDVLVYDPDLDLKGVNTGLGNGQAMKRRVYHVDSKGRVGYLSGWPHGNGLSDDFDTRVTFTGTLLRDDGRIADTSYELPQLGYVDTAGVTAKFPYPKFNAARDAIRADGSPANLNAALVRFVKVQTAVFRYGGIFGNVSTEIVKGTNLSDQSGGFPMP